MTYIHKILTRPILTKDRVTLELRVRVRVPLACEKTATSLGRRPVMATELRRPAGILNGFFPVSPSLF